MSNIVISPESGIIEFNNNSPSGDSTRGASVPIRLDATGGHSFITGGNVGIGTTSPPELLTLKGDSKALALYDGSDRLAAKLSVESTEDGALRLYERGSSKILLNANTNAVNVINPSNGKLGIGYGFNEVNAGTGSLQIAGDVGIGTNSPSNAGNSIAPLLEIYKNGEHASLKIHEDAGTHEAILHLRRGGTDWELVNDGELHIEREAEKKVTFDNLGRVGIGTSDPQAKLEVIGDISGYTGLFSQKVGIGTNNPIQPLHVKGNAYVNAGTLFIDTDNFINWGNSNQGIKAENDGNITFKAGNTNRMFLTPAGRLGIGTISPAADLHVYSAGNGEVEVQRDGGALINLQAQADKGVIGTDSNHQLDLKANSTVRMTILENGNVGIGDSSPSAKLDVAGDVAGTGAGNRITLNGLPYLLSGDFNNAFTGLSSSNVTDALGFSPLPLAGGTMTGNTKFADNVTLGVGGGFDISLLHDGTDSFIQNANGTLSIIQNADSKNIELDCDNGAGGTTTYIQLKGSNQSVNIPAGDFTVDTNTLFVDASTNRVGIRTGVPSSSLHVNGVATISSNIELGSSARVRWGNGDAQIIEGKNSNYSLTFGTYDGAELSDKMIILGNGNVGIGTTEPVQTLQVIGSISGTSGFFNNNLDVGSDIRHNGNISTKLSFSTDVIDFHAGSPHMIQLDGASSQNAIAFNIDANDVDFKVGTVSSSHSLFVRGSDGKVGIGTNNVTQGKVEIYGNGVDTELCIHEDANTHEARLHLRRGGNDWEIINSGPMSIEVEGSEVVRFATDGKVGIGTNSPSFPLSVSGEDANGTAVQVIGDPTRGGTIRFDRGNHYQFRAGIGGASSTNSNIPASFFGIEDAITNKVGIAVAYDTARVGINSTNPTQQLSVHGAIAIESGSATGSHITNHFGLRRGDAGEGILDAPGHILINIDTNLNNTDRYFAVTNVDNELFRVQENGNVGIGTNSPDDKFHIEEDGGSVVMGSPTTSYGGIGFEDTALTAGNSALFGNAGHTVLGVKAGGFIEMKIANDGGGNGVLRMDEDKLHYTNGKFGIGTNSPASDLHILGANDVGGGITLSTSASNSTNKVGRIKVTHYNTSEEPVTMLLSNTQSSANIVTMGGGSSAENAATELRFKTAANNTTTNGTERMRITSAGNVGIGTDSPDDGKLQVLQENGGFTIVAGADVTAQSLTNDTRKFTRIGMPHYHNAELPVTLIVGDSNGTSNLVNIGGGTAAGNAATQIRFKTAANDATANGTLRMMINGAGNVGIGTDSPALQSAGTGLHIHGAVNSELKFTNGTAGATASDGTALVSNGSSFTINNREAGPITLGTNNTVRMAIDSAGTVGIGTDSPSINGSKGTLHINSDTNGAAIRLSQASNSSLIRYDDTNGLQVGTIASKNLAFETADTERITVLSNGLVGINDTSPASFRLCVGGGIKATAASQFDSVITLNDVRVQDQIRHDGDTDTRIAFSDDAISIHAGGVQMVNFSESTTDQVVVNGGNNDVDFKVMSSEGVEAFKVQGSDGFVGVGLGSPQSALNVKLAKDLSMNNNASGQMSVEGNGYIFGVSMDADAAHLYHNSATRSLILGTNETERIKIEGGGDIVINEGGVDADLRIEGSTEANLLYIDAGQDKVGIGTASPAQTLQVIGGISGSSGILDSINPTGEFKVNASNHCQLETESVGTLDQGLKIIVGAGSSSPILKLQRSNQGVELKSHVGQPRLSITAITGGHVAVNADSFETKNGSFGEGLKLAASSVTVAKIRADGHNAKGSMKFSVTPSFSPLGLIDAMILDDTGRLGIGTMSPQSKLHLYETDGAPEFRMSRSSNGQVWTQSIDSSARFQLKEAASEGGTQHVRLQIDDAGETLLAPNGGNVGVGVDNPLGKLHVKSNNAGSFTYDSTADDLIVESNADGGITIATAAANTSKIIFASPNDANGAEITYNQAGNLMKVGSTQANGELALQSANGVETMRLDNNNRVGIGTNSPAFELTVQGDISGDYIYATGMDVFSPKTTAANPRLRVGRAFDQLIQFHVDDLDCKIEAKQDADSDGDHNFELFRNFSGDGENNFRIKKGSTTQLIIDKDNKVGIGIEDPSHHLEVTGSLRADSIVIGTDTVYEHSLNLNNDGTIRIGNAEMIDKVNNDLELYQGKVYIQENGYVGIGTISATGILHVHTSENLLGLFESTDNHAQIEIKDDTDSVYISHDASADIMQLGFNSSTSSPENVTITTDGKVGIGITAPSKPLDVVGDIKSSAGVVASRVEVSSDIRHSSDENTKLSFETDTIHLETNGSRRLTVDSAGNVGIATESPSTALEVDGAIKGGVNVSAKSADFTLAATDNGDFIHGTSTSFDQISISSDLGANFNCSVIHPTQDVDIVGSSSMIINGVTNGTVTLASGFQPAGIVRIASNSYAVFGNLL